MNKSIIETILFAIFSTFCVICIVLSCIWQSDTLIRIDKLNKLEKEISERVKRLEKRWKN